MTLLVLLVIIANNPAGSMKTMGSQSLPGPVTLVPGQETSNIAPGPSVIAGGGAVSAQSQVLPLRRRASGMMSPAAAASIAVESGGQAPQDTTQPIQMQGIPSPAAAATMAPQVLPLKASDGMTLPRTAGERDDAAVEQHYGDNPGMQDATVPTRPAMTPAEAAAMSEQGGSIAAPVNHPYANESNDTAFTMPNGQY